jgi:hypothetical protein
MFMLAAVVLQQATKPLPTSNRTPYGSNIDHFEHTGYSRFLGERVMQTLHGDF